MGLFDKMKNVFQISSEEFEDDYEVVYETGEQQVVSSVEKRAKNIQNKINEGKNMAKINIVEPRVYAEIENIAPLLLEKQALLLNLKRVDEAQATRIIDYMAGIAYAVGGDIQKISVDIFLIVPANIEVEGMLSEDLDNKHLDFIDSI